MNAARRFDRLLTADGTRRLIGLLRENNGRVRYEQVVSGVIALIGGPPSAVEGTIEILRLCGVVSEADGYVACLIPSEVTLGHITASIAHSLLTRFFNEVPEHLVAGAAQINVDDDSLWVDSLRLPGHSLKWPFLLVEHGVFHRAGISSRLWRLDDAFKQAFLDVIGKANGSYLASKGLSSDALFRRMKKQAELGTQAEEWVLRYERSRLPRHPFLQQIRRISDDDVAAGFDILSFSGGAALGHDRFIEVKSYSGRPNFYWSENEIEAAKSMGELYHLYLVDRDAMDDREYMPSIIPGPFAYFFERKDARWEKEPTGFHFTLISTAEGQGPC